MTTQAAIAPSVPVTASIPSFITTDAALVAPHTMTVHVWVTAGLAERKIDLCIPNDCTPCRPKINEAIARHLPGWTVKEWRDINSPF